MALCVNDTGPMIPSIPGPEPILGEFPRSSPRRSRVCRGTEHPLVKTTWPKCGERPPPGRILAPLIGTVSGSSTGLRRTVGAVTDCAGSPHSSDPIPRCLLAGGNPRPEGTQGVSVDGGSAAKHLGDHQNVSGEASISKVKTVPQPSNKQPRRRPKRRRGLLQSRSLSTGTRGVRREGGLMGASHCARHPGEQTAQTDGPHYPKFRGRSHWRPRPLDFPAFGYPVGPRL